MLDISIVNETSPEANWNRQTDRQIDRQTDRQTDGQAGRQTGRQAEGQDHVLIQDDALTKEK